MSRRAMNKMIKKLACLFLSIAVVAGCFSGCLSGLDVGETVKTFDIETPYCDLRYPEKWKSKVKIEIDDGDYYIVKFSVDDGTPLFNLMFNGTDGYVLGTLKREEGNAVLRIISYDLDSNREDYEICCMMQEDVNVILGYLSVEYDFAVGEIIEDVPVFAIETSLAILYYPERWQNRVTVDVSDAGVKFSSNEVPLFDLLFGGNEGYLLGTYDGVALYIVSYDMKKDGYSEEEYHDLCAMQEAVNTILQYLMEDEKFVLSN